MKLVQISDIHLVPHGALLFGEDPAARLRACVDDNNRHHADAQLCVITGDLTHDGDPAAYRVLADCVDKLVPPVRLLMGNHDDRAAFFDTNFGSRSVSPRRMRKSSMSWR